MAINIDPNQIVGYDEIRNEPITRQNVHEAVQDLSAQAQAAELSGDSLKAEMLHEGINRELDMLR